jgi:hypothetical protein
LDDKIKHFTRRWFYHAGAEIIPILADELIHFRDWNPWNPIRGVNPSGRKGICGRLDLWEEGCFPCKASRAAFACPATV